MYESEQRNLAQHNSKLQETSPNETWKESGSGHAEVLESQIFQTTNEGKILDDYGDKNKLGLNSYGTNTGENRETPNARAHVDEIYNVVDGMSKTETDPSQETSSMKTARFSDDSQRSKRVGSHSAPADRSKGRVAPPIDRPQTSMSMLNICTPIGNQDTGTSEEYEHCERNMSCEETSNSIMDHKEKSSENDGKSVTSENSNSMMKITMTKNSNTEASNVGKNDLKEFENENINDLQPRKTKNAGICNPVANFDKNQKDDDNDDDDDDDNSSDKDDVQLRYSNNNGNDKNNWSDKRNNGSDKNNGTDKVNNGSEKGNNSTDKNSETTHKAKNAAYDQVMTNSIHHTSQRGTFKGYPKKPRSAKRGHPPWRHAGERPHTGEKPLQWTTRNIYSDSENITTDQFRHEGSKSDEEFLEENQQSIESAWENLTTIRLMFNDQVGGEGISKNFALAPADNRALDHTLCVDDLSERATRKCHAHALRSQSSPPREHDRHILNVCTSDKERSMVQCSTLLPKYQNYKLCICGNCSEKFAKDYQSKCGEDENRQIHGYSKECSGCLYTEPYDQSNRLNCTCKCNRCGHYTGQHRNEHGEIHNLCMEDDLKNRTVNKDSITNKNTNNKSSMSCDHQNLPNCTRTISQSDCAINRATRNQCLCAKQKDQVRNDERQLVDYNRWLNDSPVDFYELEQALISARHSLLAESMNMLDLRRLHSAVSSYRGPKSARDEDVHGNSIHGNGIQGNTPGANDDDDDDDDDDMEVYENLIWEYRQQCLMAGEECGEISRSILSPRVKSSVVNPHLGTDLIEQLQDKDDTMDDGASITGDLMQHGMADSATTETKESTSVRTQVSTFVH